MNTAQFALAALISVSSPAFAESAPVLTKTQAIFYTESIKPDANQIQSLVDNDVGLACHYVTHMNEGLKGSQSLTYADASFLGIQILVEWRNADQAKNNITTMENICSGFKSDYSNAKLIGIALKTELTRLIDILDQE